MSGRRPSLQKEATPPTRAGGSDTQPEPSATRSRGRPAAKGRKISVTPAANGENTAQDQTKSKQIVRTPRRRRGKLHQMLDMPLDIIMEICAHLQLKDVLYLSRLSKAFHAFFTHRSAQFLWKSAALNTPGLPPCPDDLSEIAYARLLFEACCYDCNAKSCSSIYWGPRVRLCKRCFQKHYWARWPLGYTHSRKDNDSATKELLHVHHSELDALLPTMRRCDKEISVHYTPQLDKLIQAWKALPQDDLGARRKEFKANHRRSTAAILETIPALESWYQETRMTRHDELSRLRKERRAAIIEHLKASGWEVEIAYLNQSFGHRVEFRSFPGVSKPQALTPRMWNRLEGPLTDYMEKVRRDRLHSIEVGKLKVRLIELGEAIEEILSGTGQHNTTPYECEIRIPELFDLVDLAKEFNLKHSCDFLRGLIEDYPRKRDHIALRELSITLRREFGLDDSVDPFSLAIGSYFRCVHCRYVFNRQHAIRHICRQNYLYSPVKPDWMSDVYFDAMVSCLPETTQQFGPQIMWSIDNFQPVFARVAQIVEACGFDVKTATVEDLDADENLRLICINHKEDMRTPIMPWRTAIQAPCCRGAERGLSVPKYERATEKQVLAMQKSGTIARTAEEEYENGYHEYFCPWQCCDGLPLSSEHEAYDHAQDEHDIMHPTEEDWVMIRTDEKIPDLVYFAAD